MQNLADLIGKRVEITLVHSEKASYTVTLHGVEQGGIWIESQELDALAGYKRKRQGTKSLLPKKRPVFFVPFSSLFFLVAYSIDLDEQGLLGDQ